MTLMWYPDSAVAEWCLLRRRAAVCQPLYAVIPRPYGAHMDAPPPLSQVARLATTYFESAGIPFTLLDSCVVADGGEYPLVNLSQKLATVPIRRWSEATADHFGAIRAITAHLDLPTDYDTARPGLRVRLAEGEGPIQSQSWPLRGRICAGLSRQLMIKVEGGAVSVPPDLLGTWDTPADQVWADALDHTLADSPKEVRLLGRDTGERIVMVTGNSWASSHLLGLERYLKTGSAYGAVACVPTNDVLLFHEITGPDFMESSVEMTTLAIHLFSNGPQSISPHLYWWSERGVQRIVESNGDGTTNPTWDRSFSRMLARMEKSA